MYIIKKTDKENLDIFDVEWETANVAQIDKINWKEYDYCPNTTAKMLYNEKGICVQMETDEEDIVARCRTQNGGVCQDSCMELFLRANENDERYINIEFNAFHTINLGFRYDRPRRVNPDVKNAYFNPQSYIDESKWILQYFIPFEFIDGLYGGHTKKMYGNIYKCGEDVARKHFVTYAPIDTPQPDFHRPEYFAEFELE